MAQIGLRFGLLLQADARGAALVVPEARLAGHAAARIGPELVDAFRQHGVGFGEAPGAKERRAPFEPYETIARMRGLQRAQVLHREVPLPLAVVQ